MVALGNAFVSCRRRVPDSPNGPRDSGTTVAAACKKQGLVMGHENHIYHRQREEHCRSMAKLASDPEVRRRHETLAELHAGRAAMYSGSIQTNSEAAAF